MSSPSANLSDEEMRKLLKPIPTQDDVLEILRSTYVSSEEANYQVIRQLDSYDDCNFQVEIEGKPYLLKIHNGVESNNFMTVFKASGGNYYKRGFAGSVIHLQNAMIECLQRNNIPTSVPIPPIVNDRDTPVSIHELPVLAQNYSPCKLVVRLMHWVPGRPMNTVTPLPLEALAMAGQVLGKIDRSLDEFMSIPSTEENRVETMESSQDTTELEHLRDPSLLEAARRFHQWDGKHTCELQKYVKAIDNEKRRAMVESVIDAFEERLIRTGLSLQFRHGILHGDYNDANILVDQDFNVSGVIDFGDSVESWRVLDVSIAMAYGMLSSYGKCNRSIAAAAAVLRGFHSVYPLSDIEIEHLVLLIACRLSCSVTLGAFSLKQNPANQYLLLHAEPAWKALELIWGYDSERRKEYTRTFNQIFQHACLPLPVSSDRIIPCDDLEFPDPSVPDLMTDIRIHARSGSTRNDKAADEDA